MSREITATEWLKLQLAAISAGKLPEDHPSNQTEMDHDKDNKIAALIAENIRLNREIVAIRADPEYHPPATTIEDALRRLKVLCRRLRYAKDHYNADIAEKEILPFLESIERGKRGTTRPMP